MATQAVDFFAGWKLPDLQRSVKARGRDVFQVRRKGGTVDGIVVTQRENVLEFHRLLVDDVAGEYRPFVAKVVKTFGICSDVAREWSHV